LVYAADVANIKEYISGFTIVATTQNWFRRRGVNGAKQRPLTAERRIRIKLFFDEGLALMLIMKKENMGKLDVFFKTVVVIAHRLSTQ
jgi:ATP-binding cassette subfamily B protein